MFEVLEFDCLFVFFWLNLFVDFFENSDLIFFLVWEFVLEFGLVVFIVRVDNLVEIWESFILGFEKEVGFEDLRELLVKVEVLMVGNEEDRGGKRENLLGINVEWRFIYWSLEVIFIDRYRKRDC